VNKAVSPVGIVVWEGKIKETNRLTALIATTMGGNPVMRWAR
jgi:hypothetical protein